MSRSGYRSATLGTMRHWLLLAAWLSGLSGCSPAPTRAPTQPEAATPGLPPLPTASPAPARAITPLSVPLSGAWRFAADPERVGEKQGWEKADLDDSGWTTVSVPHTWNVMPDYADYEGLAWYRRTLPIPSAAQGGHLRLHFEAAFYRARVWMNGEYLGQHSGGYTPFEFDVTAVARPGTENVVAVQVDNLRATDRIPAVLRGDWSFDWWNYGGLVRDVSLEITGQVFIVRQQIVAVPHLVDVDQADSAVVTTTVTVSNTTGTLFEGTLQSSVFDEAAGQSVLAVQGAPLQIPPGRSIAVPLRVELATPNLWHFDHPHLYHCSTVLAGADGQVLHTLEDTFGLRLVELKDARFYLNGEPVRLVGLTRHADSPQYGLAETVTMMATDFDDLKRLNTVLSRPVHYPQARFILDYCDRNGILLIPEVPAWQLTAAQMADPEMRALEQQQLREMILAGFNHPAVWAWSVGNEIESETTAGHDFVRDMVAYVRTLDPTRPVGFASNRLGRRPKDDATDLADFVLMNQYFGTWVGPKGGLSQALDWVHQTWPDKVVIISEYGFEPRWNALWGPKTSTLDPAQYYFISDDVPSDSEAADAVRRQLIAEQMALFRSKPFIAGAIFWTYQDYRTSSGFVMGVVDGNRARRGSWALLSQEYAPLLFESVEMSPAAGGQRGVTVTLHTRGPVEVEMPAYTLRGYSLRWAVAAPAGNVTFAQGEVALPTLAPGSTWSTRVEWAVPDEEYVFLVSVLRPTGFVVLERSYNAHGELQPR